MNQFFYSCNQTYRIYFDEIAQLVDFKAFISTKSQLLVDRNVSHFTSVK